MPSLSLKIILEDGAVTRTMKFPNGATVAEATRLVEEKILTGAAGKDYGLFLTSADDDLSGIWLEDPRRLDYYLIKDGDSLHYRCRVRTLRIRMLDGSLKTMQVDERQPVEDLMLAICSKLGITNYEEYGLCREDQPIEPDAPTTGTLTLKRKAKTREKDAAMQQLSKKLKTDDNVEWLEQRKTLRECSVAPTETLLLKRRLFYSDRKVDARDPVQLNLLYVQARDAVLQGRHPVTEDQDQVCKARWINIRDMMRRKIRERLRNPTQRSYNYKYEEEMSFMIPYFKDSSTTNEEYTDYIDDNTCEVAMTSDVFADALPEEFREPKECKPNINGMKSKDDFNQTTYQDLNPADPIDVFLITIGSTLRRFSPYYLNQAKSKIFQVVQDYELQQIMSKDDQMSQMAASSSDAR